MATISDKALIDVIIMNNGYYGDDTRVAQIVEYTNAWGYIAWGVTWVHEPLARQRRYELETFYVRNPKVIWKAGEA